MKMILINGGPHEKGCTNEVCSVIAKELMSEGIESEIICIGNDVKGCCDCGACRKSQDKICVIGDIVSETARKIKEADGVIVGSPVYCGGITGQLKSFLDRLIFGGFKFDGKAVGSFVVLRRSGAASAFRELNTIMTTHSGLVIPMSGWNIIYGHRDPKQIYEDPEGLATIKNFARNAAWTMKAISLLKDQLPMPEKYPSGKLNMIR